jgi:hypothetical protein
MNIDHLIQKLQILRNLGMTDVQVIDVNYNNHDIEAVLPTSGSVVHIMVATPES